MQTHGEANWPRQTRQVTGRSVGPPQQAATSAQLSHHPMVLARGYFDDLVARRLGPQSAMLVRAQPGAARARRALRLARGPPAADPSKVLSRAAWRSKQPPDSSRSGRWKRPRRRPMGSRRATSRASGAAARVSGTGPAGRRPAGTAARGGSATPLDSMTGGALTATLWRS